MSSLQELITDLKAAGANENTVRLAMNCYELGKTDANAAANSSWTLMCQKMVAAEREACAKEGWMAASSDCEDRVAAAIRARGQS